MRDVCAQTLDVRAVTCFGQKVEGKKCLIDCFFAQLSRARLAPPKNKRRQETMSYMLMHLHNGWAVDQAILSEERRIVIIRFGHDYDTECMKMDECLFGIANKIREMAVIYLVDITEVPCFNKMYELYDPCTVMFFYRNRHVMIDLGTGNNNKSLPPFFLFFSTHPRTFVCFTSDCF